MQSFKVDIEAAASALKTMIDDLDADSLADLFSYVYGVDVVVSDDLAFEVYPKGDQDAFEAARRSLAAV